MSASQEKNHEGLSSNDQGRAWKELTLKAGLRETENAPSLEVNRHGVNPREAQFQSGTS